MKIAIVGAGAAGCMAAIEAKRACSAAQIDLLEAGPKALAKVAITGGGRCNITNSFEGVRSLEQVYPRGHRLMKALFHQFDYSDAYAWFEDAGIDLVTQTDNCVFPKSQDAMQVVRVLLHHIGRLGIQLRCNCAVESIALSASGASGNGGFDLTINGSVEHYDKVIVTTGGCAKASMLQVFEPLGLEIVQPVPSLFSLKLENNPLAGLMGTVVEDAKVRTTIGGARFEAAGPLLITDWGVSGPAALRLSSYAARALHDCAYECTLSVQWLGAYNQAQATELLRTLTQANPRKQISSIYPQEFGARLWAFLLERSGIRPDTRCAELGGKSIARLATLLTDDQYKVKGRGKFQAEYVTCGGVALSNINTSTLECKSAPGIYFAGEVLDIDALTGGFNLQAAWTSGFVAGRSCASR